MEERKYKVVWDGEEVIASDMRLDVALVLIKGLVKEYPNNRIKIMLLDNDLKQDTQ